jgi:hypothetical protein
LKVLRNFNWFLHIQASNMSQMNVFLSAPLSAFMEQTWLKHASFPCLCLKWFDIRCKKFTPFQPLRSSHSYIILNTVNSWTVDIPEDAVVCQDICITAASLCIAIYLRYRCRIFLLGHQILYTLSMYIHYQRTIHTTHLNKTKKTVQSS